MLSRDAIHRLIGRTGDDRLHGDRIDDSSDSDALDGDLGLDPSGSDEDVGAMDGPFLNQLPGMGGLSLGEESEDEFEPPNPAVDSILEAMAVNLNPEEQDIARQLARDMNIELHAVVQVFEACGRDGELTLACLRSLD
jgi:hypothetical protein